MKLVLIFIILLSFQFVQATASHQFYHLLAKPRNQVSVAREHVCAFTHAGDLSCWGHNGMGEFGNGTTTSSLTPVNVSAGTKFILISVGYNHTCGITSSKVLQCWGENTYRTLGDGTTTNRLSPVTADAGTSYIHVSASNDFTCGITTSNALKCWGIGSYGQLGNGIADNNSYNPTVIDSGTAYRFVETASDHACAITVAGVLKCWGLNDYYRLGDGTTTMRTTPVVIDSGTTYRHVSADYAHTCGVTTQGVLKCWGYNGNGQIGNGTAPFLGTAPITVVDSGVAYKECSTGSYHSCALTVNGTLKCWGDNGSNQLGDGTTTQRTSPTVVAAGIYFKSVSSGGYSNCGISESGQRRCWGSNDLGQMGDGTTTNKSTP